MAKIWPPLGFVPRGSQLDWNTTVRVTGSWVVTWTLHPGGTLEHPATDRSPSRKRVSWWRWPPTLSIEKSWQFSEGLAPSGSAEAVKNTRRPFALRNPLPVSTRRKFVSCTRFLPSRRKTSDILVGKLKTEFTGVPGRGSERISGRPAGLSEG